MSDHFISNLLLERPAQLTGSEIVAEMRRLRPDFSGFLIAELAQIDGRGTYLLRVNSQVLTVISLDIPIPAGTLDVALKPDILWPDAARVLSKHTAHIMVACLGTSDNLTGRLADATYVTWACAAIAGLTSTLGVYRAAAESLTEVGQYLAGAAELFKGKWPLSIWIRLHFFKGEAHGAEVPIGCVTTGLYSFVGREIEFEPALIGLPKIADRIFAIVGYLLTRDPVFKDGETFGATETERIRVTRAAKGRQVALPIYRLVYESPEITAES